MLQFCESVTTSQHKFSHAKNNFYKGDRKTKNERKVLPLNPFTRDGNSDSQ